MKNQWKIIIRVYLFTEWSEDPKNFSLRNHDTPSEKKTEGAAFGFFFFVLLEKTYVPVRRVVDSLNPII